LFLPAEALRRTFRTVNPLPNLEPSWNVAPAQSAPVVRRHPETGERHLDLLKWGLLPYRTKEPVKVLRPINARAETVAKSGMFRHAFEQRRCLVPADAAPDDADLSPTPNIAPGPRFGTSGYLPGGNPASRS
jgi:putative SOS response-associated peptidase YedK